MIKPVHYLNRMRLFSVLFFTLVPLWFYPAVITAYHESDKLEKDPLLYVGGSYLKIELVPIDYNGTLIHLYPSAKIKQHYKNYLEHLEEYPEIDFATYVLDTGIIDTIIIQEETTYYLPKEEKQKYELTIENNQIYQNNELLSYKYLFIIDSNEKFMAMKKIKSGVFGRIHHTSLSQGLPVIAAGTICYNPKKKILRIDNHSGHYKPEPQILNRVLQWLKLNGLHYKVISDRIKSERRNRKFREITLKID